MRGTQITYAEIDGIPICILEDGQWCEREAGHTGPHVINPDTPKNPALAGDGA